MLIAMMAIPAPKIFVIIQRLQILSVLILLNQQGLVVELVSNAMAMVIVSIDRMVITTVELVVKDVFLAPVRIITQLVVTELTKQVANVSQILVEAALNTTILVDLLAVAWELFVPVVSVKDIFGAVFMGNVFAIVLYTMLLVLVVDLENAKETAPRWFCLPLLNQGIQARP